MFLGVFTTISGYLFAVDEMVFKENITSRNSKDLPDRDDRNRYSVGRRTAVLEYD